MLKTCDNPPVLFPPVASVRELLGPWWVAHTKARNEKAFARELITREVPYFLPQVRRIFFSGGRRRVSLVPLFGSYVFVAANDEQRHAALCTNRLCSLIAVEDQRQFLDELAAIERLVNGGVSLDPSPFAVVGQMVRIARGPFRGIVGRVIRRDNVLRLAVHVSILGRGAEMEIDSELLEPLD